MIEATIQDETQQIRLLASRVDGLPALPIIASRLLEIVDDPDTSASDLAALISTDPALATRLLKLANSAYYGFPRRIGTVNLAIVVLGLETVRDLCLSVLITDCFFQDSGNLPFDIMDFWRHSLSAAVGVRMINKQCGADRPGEGFIAGLVHDIGKLFLGKYFPDDYCEVITRMERSGLSSLEAEREQFSVTHPVVGGWLLDEWNMPVWLVEATRNHHQSSDECKISKLAQAVTFADFLVRKTLQGSDGPDFRTVITPEMLRQLKLKLDVCGEPDVELYLKELEFELERAEGFMETIHHSG